MDPDCAICHAPPSAQCDCESKGLQIAIRQAETRMMQSLYTDIREWVAKHAQDYILEYYRQHTERRKIAHTQHLEQLTAHAYHYYHAPPHPNEIALAQAALKRGIDEDWQASVQRYPEVLEYYYSLVELTLPAEDDIQDPPLSAMNGSSRKGSTRATAGSGDGRRRRRSASRGMMDSEGMFVDRELPRGKTPPPMGGFGAGAGGAYARTPGRPLSMMPPQPPQGVAGMPGMRHAFRASMPPAPPGTAFYPGY